MTRNQYYNASARPLKPLHIGQEVRLQHPLEKHWEIIGCIIEIGKFRDYLVKLPCGKSYWRNRRFLKPTWVQNTSSRRGVGRERGQ